VNLQEQRNRSSFLSINKKQRDNYGAITGNRRYSCSLIEHSMFSRDLVVINLFFVVTVIIRIIFVKIAG